MSILTNYNNGHMKICHYREISDDAELVMLSILVIHVVARVSQIFQSTIAKYL
jgi:hypothetical protein